jgi:pSer/pThr/pTyr-binding forkhead associated (FHA) protein
VVLGRTLGDVRPDLDLTPFGADEAGVSRKHALLRPSSTNLFLVDLGSMNGTFHNGRKLGIGVAQTLKDKDVITLGAMHIAIRIVGRPEKKSDK